MGSASKAATQFRRMIREIPAGRTVELKVWRDGRAQTLSAKLDQAEELHRAMTGAMPGSFAFRMPEVEVPDMPEMPEMPAMPDGPVVAFDDGDMLIPIAASAAWNRCGRYRRAAWQLFRRAGG